MAYLNLIGFAFICTLLLLSQSSEAAIARVKFSNPGE